MKKYRSTLPPLDLLIFFEAAHRRGSFTACAAELHVTQAAVSKRIRQLEDWVGEPLFLRHGTRLQTTESGERLYHSVGMALEFLRMGLTNLREQANRPLSIAANTVVGMFWLAPQLQDFGLSGDACPTRLTTSDNSSALLADGNDLLLLYTDGDIPGWTCTRLLDEEMTPMASPELAARIGARPDKAFAALCGPDAPPLLTYRRGSPDWVDWLFWFKAIDAGRITDWPVRLCSTYSQSIGEALRGKGIALGSMSLLSNELAAGRLVVLSKDVLRTNRGYYLCQDQRVPPTPDAQRLTDFLISRAAAQI